METCIEIKVATVDKDTTEKMSKNYTEIVAPVTSTNSDITTGTQLVPLSTKRCSLFNKKIEEHTVFTLRVSGADPHAILADVSFLMNILFAGVTRAAIINVYVNGVELMSSDMDYTADVFNQYILSIDLNMKTTKDSSKYEITNWIDATTEITFMMMIMKALAKLNEDKDVMKACTGSHDVNILNAIPLMVYMSEHLMVSSPLYPHEFNDVDGIINACDGFTNILNSEYLFSELVKHEKVVDKSVILHEIQNVIRENASLDDITKIYKRVIDISDEHEEKPLGESSMLLRIMLAISNAMDMMKRRPLNNKYEGMTFNINRFFESKMETVL